MSEPAVQPPQPFQANPPPPPPGSHNTRRPVAWPAYGVLVVLCSIGGAGVLHGIQYKGPVTTEDPAPTSKTVPTTETTASVTPAPTAKGPSPEGRTSPLIIDDLVIGTGATARSGDAVKVHYVGTLSDGKEFDSSRKHGTTPFAFDLGKGRVIKGWDTGVAGMKVGGKRKLTIPPHLGYGDRGAGGVIPPKSTLVFEVELIEVSRDGDSHPSVDQPPGADPLKGSYTIFDATQDLPGTGKLMTDIDTSRGRITCQLYDSKAPNTVANYIGLATGKRVWRDPLLMKWQNKPAYDNSSFHRTIKGFMIQGGDPLKKGTGEPGYVFNDENWEGAKHDRAGLLCMANRGPNTNGAQFFITDAAAPHIDGSYTVFGECTSASSLATIHDIASVPTSVSDAPTTPVNIQRVSIYRDN